ncbi:MAG: bifunctional diaminohydroxyphosphoribosylaminopyrimidine deaminase/5-amino-6-(5-phosphoribosylamino)uracil reductase RibD [Hahellaceae bacterium]|nr:bifunctional diaminohydroxyphosphoribosylaminopyrimidine deaminase/5-amino-6-(5-phosphoribosylamino)uracil reductase RibD [Hahellaceae bacterium]
MARALKLAEKGLYTTHPNPRVGCVIVKNGEIIGEGWHERAGEPHAEVHALRQAGERARGADVYVTLEPCSHHGRTPPCANALIDAGVSRVWAGSADPNPLVAGRGLERLQQAGIAVQCGVLQTECETLNIGFFQRFKRGRPWVRLKTAASLDGRVALASGASKWLTGESARQDVQRLRARSSAIVTGINTVLADDPALTVRDDGVSQASAGRVRQPLRIVLDRQLRLTDNLQILADTGNPVLIVTTPQALASQPAVRLERLRQKAEILTLDPTLDLSAFLAELASRGVNEVLVEAGGTLAGAFLQQGLCDEYWLYIAPKLLGPEGIPMANIPSVDRLSKVPHFKIQSLVQVGNDVRMVMVPDLTSC